MEHCMGDPPEVQHREPGRGSIDKRPAVQAWRSTFNNWHPHKRRHVSVTLDLEGLDREWKDQFTLSLQVSKSSQLVSSRSNGIPYLQKTVKARARWLNR